MTGMTISEYVAWQESIGRGVLVMCPWCGDWEDIDDGVFSAGEPLRFWCCFGCAVSPYSERTGPEPWQWGPRPFGPQVDGTDR